MNTHKNQANEDLHDWELHYTARADASGTVLRGLLAAVSTAGFGYIGNTAEAGDYSHLAAAICFFAALSLLLFSWFVQKDKALSRAKYVSNKMTNPAKDQAEKSHVSNWHLDLLAAFFVLSAGLVLLVDLACKVAG